MASEGCLPGTPLSIDALTYPLNTDSQPVCNEEDSVRHALSGSLCTPVLRKHGCSGQ